MSMSDCIKCWDTPCTCGYDYRNMPKSQRIALAAVILGVSVAEVRYQLIDIVPNIHPMKEEE